MSEENVEIVRRVWQAAEGGDMDALFALYDPDIVWKSYFFGPIEFGGLYRGHEGVRQFFRDWLESFETYQAHAEIFIDGGDNVVVGYRVSGRGKASGAQVDMHRWNVYAVRNGLVTYVEIFGSKAQALDAAGLSGM
jgi:ketosteroid isomerase-like protein